MRMSRKSAVMDKIARKHLLIVVPFGLAMRLSSIVLFRSYFRAADTALYVALARSIIGGHGYAMLGHQSAFYPPLYPLFLASIFLFAGENLLPVQVAQAFLSAAAIPVVYYLGRVMFDNWVAFWSAAILAIHPWIIYWSGFVLTDTLFLTILTLAVLSFAFFMKTPTFSNAVVSGVLFGLAALCRPQGLLIFVGGMAVWLILFRHIHRKYRLLLPVTVAFLLVISPWIIRNYLVFDTLVIADTSGGLDLYLGNNPAVSFTFGYSDPSQLPVLPATCGPSEPKTDTCFRNLALQYIYQNPISFTQLAARRSYLFWSPTYPTYSLVHNILNTVFYLPLYFGALVGFIELARGSPSQKRFVWLFLTTVLLVTLTHAATVVDLDQRYRLPLQPFLALLAGSGLVHSPTYIRRARR